MKSYVKPKDKLYNKTASSIVVSNVDDKMIKAVVNGSRELAFKTSDIGKVLFFSPKHVNLHFSNPESYISFFEQEFKISKQKEINKRSKLINFNHKSTRISKESQIREIICTRDIKSLVHFTRVENIDSIKQHGILSVKDMKEQKILYIPNDTKRWDLRTDCISLSISKHNKFLLDEYKRNYKDCEWKILYIDPLVLLNDDSISYFCKTNAANKCISSKLTNNKGCIELSKPEAFNSLFDKTIQYRCSTGECRPISRIRQEYNQPTDVQAEIMYKGRIHPKYILNI